jgi:hypothetical protein
MCTVTARPAAGIVEPLSGLIRKNTLPHSSLDRPIGSGHTSNRHTCVEWKVLSPLGRQMQSPLGLTAWSREHRLHSTLSHATLGCTHMYSTCHSHPAHISKIAYQQQWSGEVQHFTFSCTCGHGSDIKSSMLMIFTGALTKSETCSLVARGSGDIETDCVGSRVGAEWHIFRHWCHDPGEWWQWPGQGGSNRGKEKWSDGRHILQVELTESANGIRRRVWFEREREKKRNQG